MFKQCIAAIGIGMMATTAMAGEVSGTASYREKIALPPEATFQAILYDISNNDQVEIGRFETTGDAGPPYQFTITYADDAVVEDGLYAIQTKVIWPDKPYVAAGMILEGFPGEDSADIDLVMVRPGAVTLD